MAYGVRLTGDWARAGAILAQGAAKLRGAMRRALVQEAHFFRSKVVEGIRNQAPGGKRFKPLSPWTIATRRLLGFGGSKALIQTASLIRSVTVKHAGDWAFVGVLRSARNREGKSLMNIAVIQEYGAGPFVVQITPKMARFLAAVARKLKKSKPVSTGGATGGSGFLVIRIPPRPFLQPTFDKWAGNAESQRRFVQRVAKQFAGTAAAALFEW